MSGEVTVTPGIVFGSETVDNCKLNFAATPIAIINDGAVTLTELDETLVQPSMQTLSSAASTSNWTCVSHRVDQLAKITLTRNITLNFIDIERGMYGYLFAVQGGAGTYTIAFPSNTKVSPSGGNPISITNGVGKKDLLYWIYTGDTGFFYVHKVVNFT